MNPQSSIIRNPDAKVRVDGNSQRLMSQTLSDAERFVLDAHASHIIPKDKSIFISKWTWSPRGSTGSLSLGKVGIMDYLMKLRWGRAGSVIDSEIHVIYLPHIPVEIYRNHNLNIDLIFDGAGEEDERVMSKATFPSSLHTHVIFYPGHSFSLGLGSKFPWSLSFSTTAEIMPEYKIADILVLFKGYNTQLGQSSMKTGADIISLVPATDLPTGITLTRPRGGGDWTVKGLHFGVRSEREIKAILMIQEAGIDVEGLQLTRNLEESVKVIYKIMNRLQQFKTNEEKFGLIRDQVFPLIKRKR